MNTSIPAVVLTKRLTREGTAAKFKGFEPFNPFPAGSSGPDVQYTTLPMLYQFLLRWNSRFKAPIGGGVFSPEIGPEIKLFNCVSKNVSKNPFCKYWDSDIVHVCPSCPGIRNGTDCPSVVLKMAT